MDKIIILVFIFNLVSPPPIEANDLSLPPLGVRIHLSPEYSPVMLEGVTLDLEKPLDFQFILSKGHDQLTQSEMKEQSKRLIKYFLASITTPDDDLWVNLSPYESKRVIPESFGKTLMGRDMLAQDYLLKQITSSLMYPEDDIGKIYWEKIYKEAAKRFGTTNIPVNTFNKVWIVPEKAEIYENIQTKSAFVVESSLKVMLEEDYLAHEKVNKTNGNQWQKEIIREHIIPILNKEINQGKNFAKLRQVYHSLILATWYKQKIKNSILSMAYTNQNKIEGININNKDIKDIYDQYIQSFKKGVYNYIKEDEDVVAQQKIVRKYFSGGEDFAQIPTTVKISNVSAAMSSLKNRLANLTMYVVLATMTVVNPVNLSAQTGNDSRLGAKVEEIQGFNNSEKSNIKSYIEGFKIGSINFASQMTGEDAAKELGFYGDFKNFYDQLRVEIKRKLRTEGRVTAKDVIGKSQKVLDEDNNISPYKKEGFGLFFEDGWTEYMIALANKQRDLPLIEKDLLYQAKHYTPEFLEMIKKLTLQIKTDDEEGLQRVVNEWIKFNEKYLIPNMFYVELSVMKNRQNHQFYFSVVYKIEKIEERKVNNKIVKVIYGRKFDQMNTKGHAAHSVTGERIVFVNLDDIDEYVKRINDVVVYNKDYLKGGEIDGSFLNNYIKSIYPANTNDIKAYVLKGMRGHEFTHQAQDMLGVQYNGNDNFGLNILSSKDRKAIDKETAAILGQMLQVKDSRSELFYMLEHIYNRQANPYSIGARWIFNMLDGNNPDGTFWQDPNVTRSQFERLYNLGNDELRKRAEELLKKYWPGLLEGVRTMNNAMIISTKDLSERIKFETNTGGIDLTTKSIPLNITVETNDFNNDQRIVYDKEIIEQILGAQGLEPKINDIKPILNFDQFLQSNQSKVLPIQH